MKILESVDGLDAMALARVVWSVLKIVHCCRFTFILSFNFPFQEQRPSRYSLTLPRAWSERASRVECHRSSHALDLSSSSFICASSTRLSSSDPLALPPPRPLLHPQSRPRAEGVSITRCCVASRSADVKTVAPTSPCPIFDRSPFRLDSFAYMSAFIITPVVCWFLSL